MKFKITFILCVILFLQNNFVLAEDNIKIGAMLHLTGEFPMQGKAFREGAELAVTD